MSATRVAVRVLAVALAAAIGAACSSGGGPSAAAKSAFVTAEASALCAVRNHKFADERAQLAAYTDEINRAGLTQASLAALKKDMEHDGRLRQAITARVAAMCS
jgi:hypothetical protein